MYPARASASASRRVSGSSLPFSVAPFTSMTAGCRLPHPGIHHVTRMSLAPTGSLPSSTRGGGVTYAATFRSQSALE